MDFLLCRNRLYKFLERSFGEEEGFPAERKVYMTCLTIICLYSTIFTSPLGNYLLISVFAQVLSNCFVNSVNEETDCAYFVSIVVITRIKISKQF